MLDVRRNIAPAAIVAVNESKTPIVILLFDCAGANRATIRLPEKYCS